MTSIRRRIGAVCAAGGVLAGTVLAAGQLPAAASASSKPTISVKVATPGLRRVSGHVWVYYKVKGYSSANVDATLSGVHSGEYVTLRARRFPFKKAPAVIASTTVPSGFSKITFSNTVTPTLATRYTVAVYASKRSRTPLATSASTTVYVVPRGHSTGGNKPCAGPECHYTIKMYVPVPAAALRREMSKHVYAYFGIARNAKSTPAPPKVLRLGAGHVKVAKSRRISAGEFEVTMKFSFWVGKDSYYWLWHACQKSTESKDGISLPGSHGCGAKTLSTSRYFVG